MRQRVGLVDEVFRRGARRGLLGSLLGPKKSCLVLSKVTGGGNELLRKHINATVKLDDVRLEVQVATVKLDDVRLEVQVATVKLDDVRLEVQVACVELQVAVVELRVAGVEFLESSNEHGEVIVCRGGDKSEGGQDRDEEK